jgi:hypothetical protein
MSEAVVPLFRRPFVRDVVPEVPLPSMPGFGHGPREPIATSAVNLSDKPKIWFEVGSGGSGKTVFARAIAGRMYEGGRSAEIAALDPTNRSLATWFDNVWTPESRDGADKALWLRDFLDFVTSEKRSAILDFGGGDSSLARVLEIEPDLHKRLAAEGVAPVACYLLTPRVDDLAILKSLEDAGFQPEATVLLLNEGRKDSTMSAEAAFGPVIEHSAFKAATARGAAALWLPALEADVALEIEQKHLSFGQAANGKVPEGATFYPIGGLRRSMVGRWLGRVEQALSPIRTWLP